MRRDGQSKLEQQEAEKREGQSGNPLELATTRRRSCRL